MAYAEKNYGNASLTATQANSIEPETPSKIRDGITTAEQFQSEINEHISLLEKRLDTVLRPVPPSGQGANVATPQPVCSHVTGRLNLLNEGLHGIVTRLRELRDRVEV